MTELQSRWGFLAPWCRALRNRVSYGWAYWAEEVWDLGRCQFVVDLPTRRDEDGGGLLYSDEVEFRAALQQFREALALLAAVAHADRSAWEYLLEDCCGVPLHDEGETNGESQDTPARLVVVPREKNANLLYPETLKEDLIQLCDTNQRTESSSEYEEALRRIAALDGNLQQDKPGVDIQVPMHMWFHVGMSKSAKPIEDIQSAAAEIQRGWERSEHSLVGPGALRCTLVLEPTIAIFSDYVINPNVADTVERLVRENNWFSQFTLWVNMDRELRSGELPSIKTLGRLMASLFVCGRRPYEEITTKYHRKFETPEARPLQMGTVHLICASWLEAREVEATCSAIAVCQKARKLSMRLEMYSTNVEITRQWWRWIAYALFSKRARTSSSVDSLALTAISAMSAQDMEAFAAILASDHPEEELFGCPRGTVEERDATLKENASIYSVINYRGMPSRASRITPPSHVRTVRCFSDDGASEWVNTLVPGYGRCLINREDLVFHEREEVSCGPCSVASLWVGFEKDYELHYMSPAISTGLPRFLELVGQQLKVLTLEGPRVEIPVDAILRSCPWLEELSICGYFVDANFHFSEYQGHQLQSASFNYQWEDIAALAAALSDSTNPMAKCVRRLRVRLTNREMNWGHHPRSYNPFNLETHANALLQMLKVNRSLQYLDVIVPSANALTAFSDCFKWHHRTPTNRSVRLMLENKLAFLSVVAVRRTSLDAAKKRKQLSSPGRSVIGHLDQNVLANVFALAATPIYRSVHCRVPCADEWEEERLHVLI